MPVVASRWVFLVSTFGLLLSSRLHATELAPGQVWKVVGAPAESTRVIIGKIEPDTEPKVVHIAVEGMPILDRDPAVLHGGVAIRGVSDRQQEYWCEYALLPSPDNKSIEIRVIHMPYEYSALQSSLSTLEATGAALDVHFERSWDRWDYFRDEYGFGDPRAPYATKSLSEMLQIIEASANRSLSMMARFLSADEDE